MKCPFCQQELLLSSFRDGDEEHQMWNCLSCQLSAQRKLWQELIRTRNALDVAVMALKEFDKNNIDYGPAFEALHIIKQITESPAENVQPDTKSRPVNVQEKMTPEELDELELLVNATFK